MDPYLGATVPYLGMFAQDSGQSEHTTLVALVWEESYKYVEDIEGTRIMFLCTSQILRLFILVLLDVLLVEVMMI